MIEIYSISKLCSLLNLKKEYLFDLADRAGNCYHSYEKNIIHKDGTTKKRRIDSPNIELKAVQERINNAILRPLTDALPEYMHGSRHGKSITTNASVHVGKEAILFLDIQDCFPSIDARRLYYVYRNLLHCSDQVASILLSLTTKNGLLPQGCPTSPSLCNLALAHMLEKMAESGEKLNLAISQYIDDIFYSGGHSDVRRIVDPALKEIRKAGLTPNRKKVRIGRNSCSLQVTGVVVNAKTSAGRTRIHRVERKILRITAKDKHEYNATIQQRRLQAKSKQKRPITSCRIEQLLGEISSIISVNKQQGYRLKGKLDKKLQTL